MAGGIVQPPQGKWMLIVATGEEVGGQVEGDRPTSR